MLGQKKSFLLALWPKPTSCLVETVTRMHLGIHLMDGRMVVLMLTLLGMILLDLSIKMLAFPFILHQYNYFKINLNILFKVLKHPIVLA